MGILIDPPLHFLALPLELPLFPPDLVQILLDINRQAHRIRFPFHLPNLLLEIPLLLPHNFQLHPPLLSLHLLPNLLLVNLHGHCVSLKRCHLNLLLRHTPTQALHFQKRIG